MIHKDKKGREHKVCTKCDKLKSVDDFWIDRRRNKPKPRARCKDCERGDDRLYKYRKRVEESALLLPVAPLLGIVEQARAHEESWEDLAYSWGVSAKTFYEWRTGKRTKVNLDTADKILIGSGLIWEDVFDDKTCERLRAVA